MKTENGKDKVFVLADETETGLALLFDRAVSRHWNPIRSLIDGHEVHEPDAIARIRQIYRRAATPAANTQAAKNLRTEALSQLRYLDQAGFACDRCAPMSACEIEEELEEKRARAGRGA